MNKLFIFSTLAYLLFTINSRALEQEVKKDNTLDVGVLLPLSGKYQHIGKSFLKAIKLALYDISNDNIKIYLKDSKGNALDAYQASKDFEELGIKIVIGPIFNASLERLDEVNSITFISLTNRSKEIPKNSIAFGINIDSQINTLKNYFKEIDITKTIFLSPKSEFIYQSESIAKNDILKFYRTYSYDISPKKITGEIEKITKYRERKRDLERRIKILEKSDLDKDKNELKKLEQMHTLGKVNFDSVFVMDFGERLKSVLTSFMFSDVSSDEIKFFTINQWFDETLFNENAMQNLHFPAIELKNLKKFNKKFLTKYNEESNEVGILAYDALGLIYHCWLKNNFEFKAEHLYDKKGFKGLHGQFVIENNQSKQKLGVYKILKKKFIKVY